MSPPADTSGAPLAPLIEAQLNFILSQSKLPIKVGQIWSGCRDGRYAYRFTLAIPCLDYVYWHFLYNALSPKVAPDVVFGPDDEGFQPLVDSDGAGSGKRSCLARWDCRDTGGLLTLVKELRELYIEYQKKLAAEVDDARLKFEISTVMSMEPDEVKFAVPLLDVDFAKLVPGCPWKLPQKIHLQILVPIANGTEEMEAIMIIDILRRAKANVVVVSIEETLEIVASRKVKMIADVLLDDALKQQYDLILLPGGLGGAQAYANSDKLIGLIKKQAEANKLYGAICASPAIALEPHGLLKGKKATSYPAMWKKLSDQSECLNRVVVDGNLITSQGPGTSMEFSLAIVEKLFGRERAPELAKTMDIPGCGKFRELGLQNEEELTGCFGDITTIGSDHWSPYAANIITSKRPARPVQDKGKRCKIGTALLIQEAITNIASSAKEYASKREGKYSIEQVMEVVLACGAGYETDEHYIATKLFVKKEQREMFMTLPSNEIRFNWLRRKYNDKYSK